MRRPKQNATETLLVLAWLLSVGRAEQDRTEAANNRRVSRLEADQNGLYVLGLFDLHGASPRAPFKCGPIDTDQSRRAMQNMAAFHWALEQVNQDDTVLPGVRLGALTMDTCSSPLRTNQQVANLLHGAEPEARRIVGVLADQADGHSVESVASMASALGVATFVTQSRSSRLGELVRRYQQPSSTDSPEVMLGELLGIGRMLVGAGQQQADRLLMLRFRPSNELLAEAIAALLQRMGWDFVSLVHDEEPEMVDLHEQLARVLFNRNVQIALDEQISSQASAQAFDQLVDKLASKSEIGARLVIGLLGSASSRQVLESQIRRRKQDKALELVWVSVADREPFYSLASEALGTVAVSSSSSLLPEFSKHFNELPLAKPYPANPWWAEYMRAVVARSSPDPSSGLSECAKEDNTERCSSLTLSALDKASNEDRNVSSRATSGRFLGGGWEHNGMDTINAVLVVANGLEAVRQALCPGTKSGLCERMRSLLSARAQPQSSLSELLFGELFSSTFQLADGRMFNLDEASQQLDCKVKFYNLRYLQQNSIGFVKFATYEPGELEPLTLNASKARYPASTGRNYRDQVSLDKLKSSCEHASRCLLSASLGDPQEPGKPLSEEDLAASVNSLLKLDHPLISNQLESSQVQLGVEARSPPNADDGQVQRLRSPPTGSQQFGGKTNASWKAPTSFDTIVLLPLHKANAAGKSKNLPSGHQSLAGKCSDRMDTEGAFQQLVALAYAQKLANSANYQPLSREPQIELTTTVIDYCDQADWAQWKLSEILLAKNNSRSRHVAIIDFDSQISERIHSIAYQHNLLHLSIGSNAGLLPAPDAGRSEAHLAMSLLPSKASEIEALVSVISAMAQWRLVHLIYTDHHWLRDQFVHKANEANICVSKLIWVPHKVEGDTAGQVQRLARLFASELHDYRSSGPTAEQEGLNSTRLLVVLASSSPATNQLILEAASESMLTEYVWLTSHEWLRTIEMKAEQRSSEAALSSSVRPRLPRLYLSTSLETFESLDFRRYLADLSPAIHAPIPTGWFDQFWQQHFNCRLPIPGAISGPHPQQTCLAGQRLEAHQVVEDDRVHYTIQAIESIYAALLAGSDSHLFAANFKRAFERSRQLSSSELDSPLANMPYGYHIILRLLPAAASDDLQTAQRPNSRAELDPGLEESDYSAGAGQLLRVGLWRQGKLLLMRRKGNETSKSWLRGAAGDLEESGRVSSSLAQLDAIKSRCSSKLSCLLCQSQIEQTRNLLRLEEARLNLSSSGSEPRAISPLLLAQAKPSRSASSALDKLDMAISFDDELAQSLDPAKSIDRDEIQASASSLFNAETSKQFAGQYQSEVRRVYAHMLNSERSRSLSSIQPAGSLLSSALSLLGIVCMLLSIAYFYPKAQKATPKTYFDEPRSAAMASSGLSSMADYLTLTGLLMLYSINIAFLLPANTNVCWFRRVGLGASYVLVLSSILVRAVKCLRDSKLCNRKPQVPPARSSPALQNQSQPDPIEDNVELTFESIPHDLTNQPARQERPTSGYQTGHLVSEQPTRRVEETKEDSMPSIGIFLPLALIIAQLLLSILWLWLQPPEPTLFRHCWYCSSPNRSPILFLYEPLLSLLFAAGLLFAGWLVSLLAYQDSSSAESEPPSLSNWQKSNCTNRELVRESKSLVMSTTLLIVTWMIATLNMISTGNNPATNPSVQHFSVQVLEHHPNQLQAHMNLVYANIISGAIVFSFLFIYRLNLFAGTWRNLSKKCLSSGRSSSFASQRRLASSTNSSVNATPIAVLKFNQSNGPPNAWPGAGSYATTTPTYAGDSIFTGSQFSTGGHQERLRLQQFNSYGTYTNPAESHPTVSGSDQLALSFAAIASSFTGGSAKSRKRSNAKRRQNDLSASSLQAAPELRSKPAEAGGDPAIGRTSRRTSPSLLFRSINKKHSQEKPRSSKTNPTNGSQDQLPSGSKLQRRQSAGSVASSTAKLVRDNSSMSADEAFMDDNISCVSSVASSSTSQLHGNDLYPIDCSIQLDSTQQLPTQAPGGQVARSASFSRRSSIRRSINSKLDSVLEEHQKSQLEEIQTTNGDNLEAFENVIRM